MEPDPQPIFERFVVGPANRVAATAARRVAESPGTSYNPLVICGPSGLGKTHLLSAVGDLARSLQPDLHVHYETMDSFVDRLTTSISAGRVDEFREATGRIDLLLLDDFQHAAGKARTQEELLRTWEAMLQRGSQVVVAADRTPQEIPALDTRLATRLAGGLIVDIATPETPTRLTIIRQLLAERGVALSGELVQAVAALQIQNVRELQGAVNRILAAIEIEQRPVEAAEIPELLGLTDPPAASADNEFGDFLSDISTAVAAVVETAPWRRRIAEAILRWEGEGVRTRRLEEALDADSAPDVDALLTSFARDVGRLRELARELPGPPEDPLLLVDPDRLPEAEEILARARAEGAPAAAPAQPTPRHPSGGASPAVLDDWFLDREKLAWDWLALEERLVEEVG